MEQKLIIFQKKEKMLVFNIIITDNQKFKIRKVPLRILPLNESFSIVEILVIPTVMVSQ